MFLGISHFKQTVRSLSGEKFNVCSPFATSQEEAEHHVLSWLDWVDPFPSFNYDPPFESWEPKDEPTYIPDTQRGKEAISSSIYADLLIDHLEKSKSI